VAERDATTTDESALLARVAGGDRRAFEQLYRIWAPRVFRFVDRLLGDHARSEEVTDDVMLEVWKNAPRFEGRSRPSTWVLGIARLKALSALRARRPGPEEIDDASAPADPAEAVDERLDREASAARVRGALASLSAEQREVVELTFFHGLAYDEIAALVGCPLGTVKTRMFHARKRLAPLLAASAEERP
jgi:RNA polymerase sigma-70 factor (ECF subfamily)